MIDVGPVALSVIVVSTPLLLAALGELVSERSGVLNIGIEGLMLAGCFVAFAVTLRCGDPYLGALAAAAAGGALGLGLAAVVVGLRADAVVAGTGLNLLMLGATSVAYRATVGVTGKATLVEPLPRFVLPGLALPLMLGVAWFLYRTRPGLMLRAAGEDPAAAHAVGVPVLRLRVAALAFGGMMAGAAGAQLCLVHARTFGEGMTAGRGFLALAVVVCGRWSTRGTLAAALLFGAATAFQYQFQARGWSAPYQLFLMLPYVVTLVVLALVAADSRAPAGLGR